MDCTTVGNLVMTEDSHTTAESFKENAAPLSQSPSPALPGNEGFSREQTLFLIDLMRQHLAAESDGLPKSLKELNSRLKLARCNKKNLWKETAEKLCIQYSELFCPDKVARKWNTLIDAYKIIKDNNKSTGKFFEEMDDLLAGQHDVVFPVVGTSAGLDIRRPEVLGPSAVTAPPAEAASCSSTHTAPTHTRPLISVGGSKMTSSSSSRKPVRGAMRRHRGATRSSCLSFSQPSKGLRA
ncbi:uncharacterized protein LOC115588612 isoform X2 [Sparus aurata]|nr:uncharacterized protein LOC115588612 isoform X2 [Sparus aurata]XP_030285169.1 uncharacterized protein LOC115588612 isoform X2 [Sparus aurata]